ncbi:DHA2 family efflux MFS transporter permease subunit [Paenibacillus sp. YN15]|uniref:DHA2 family efflux MFS transporter permease subunit n=1 Tax=Paenibacillus sp. YN15 TaxID=1742774 RepID=UPI000DCB2E06|nr:DHA2 family efflux MFS transporter permease subunit [Paenibacillus sp. YN15]RAU93317.1 MFS transporter [Paenibacillus sp. YN15]
MSERADAMSIKKGPILFIMILGAFIAILNQTIMTVALPELIKDFAIAASTAQWLTTGYMLVNGVLVPVTAYLMQRFTTRELFLASMVSFLAGSAIAAAAPGFEVLLAGRLIQAAGAGIIMPLLMNVVLVMIPEEKRGGVMGLIGLSTVLAPAVGPVYAGFMLEHFSWRSLFYVMIPMSVLVAGLSLFYLKNVTKRMYLRLDGVGMAVSTLGFGTLLYGFSRAGTAGWSSPEVLGTLLTGAAALIFFTVHQLRSRNPLLDLKAFRYSMFSLTTVINIVVTIVMYSDMILLPLYLQNMRSYSAFDTGMLMLPGALLMGLLMPLSGKLFDRIGAKWLSLAGIAITIITTAGFVSLTESTSFMYLMLMSAGRRIGMALFLMPVTTAGLNQLPATLHAHGTAISNTVKQVAGAIGTALLVTILSSRTQTHALSLAAEGLRDQAQLIQKASIAGMNDAYWVVIACGVIGLALSFFIRKTKPAALAPEPEEEKGSASLLPIQAGHKL